MRLFIVALLPSIVVVAGCPPPGYYGPPGQYAQQQPAPSASAQPEAESGGSAPAATPSCPAGSSWDGSKCVGQVAPAATPSCPAGSNWDGSKCVGPVSPSCPSGSTFDGTTCVGNVAPSCPSGMHFKTGVGCVGGAAADRDGDGVADDVDRCPDVAGVPPDGCPTRPRIHDRFTELTPGALRDEQTGIQWQRSAPSETFRHADAASYCAHLPLDHGGWRLPSKDELRSLVKKGSTPRIDTTAFPSTPADEFWTSTASVGSIMTTVSFRSGDDGSSPSGIAQHVRCARTRSHR